MSWVMALSRFIAVGLSLGHVLAFGQPGCMDGECGVDESSLLALRTDAPSARKCTNLNGDIFECSPGNTCCGNGCKAPSDKCCHNVEGYPFACHGDCCGNACAAPGSKCCRVGPREEWYPVSKESECKSRSVRTSISETSTSRNCTNLKGDQFQCGPGDTCCGNGCKAPSDKCCHNVEGYPFACHGNCCGNACAAPGSKCCRVGPREEWYPVSEDTECKSRSSSRTSLIESSSSGTCTNLNGDHFECGPGDTCCGNGCKAANDKCCHNVEGYPFACHGDCCGNACAAPGSKCCRVGPREEWYPVSKESECKSRSSGRTSLSEASPSRNCTNLKGDHFQCGPGDTCCGNGCKAPNDKCCHNVEGYPFACHGDCCGNACAAPGSKCCRVGPREEWYPVSKESECKSRRRVTTSISETPSSRNCTNLKGNHFQCGPGDTCCGNGCKAPNDKCCHNVEGYPFACHGNCCGNACAAPGSKCCRVGPREEWYPVSEETECKSRTSSKTSLSESPSSGTCINLEGHQFECGPGDTCCGNGCKAPSDRCCHNVEGYPFACHGNCCGNACAAPGSKCCRVGPREEWYPVSSDTECRSVNTSRTSVSQHQA